MTTQRHAIFPAYTIATFDFTGQAAGTTPDADAWVRLITGPFGAIIILILWVWWFQAQQKKSEERQQVREDKHEAMQERQIAALERMNQFTAQNTQTIKELTAAIQALHNEK